MPTSGRVALRMGGMDSPDLEGHLSATAVVRTRVVFEHGYGFMRLSTHLYDTEAEPDRVPERVEDAAASRG